MATPCAPTDSSHDQSRINISAVRYVGVYVTGEAIFRPRIEPGVECEVFALVIGDGDNPLRIPWPEGLTMRDALLAWKRDG